MKKLTTLFVGLCFLTVGTQAQEMDLNKKLPLDKNVKIGKLDNGITYYIRNNGKPEDKVELRLVVNAGSVLETDRQVGLAHFMEHMNFNGTKNFQKNQLVDYLQSIGVKFGADLNAYTSFDETVYILPIPSDDPEKLEKGFQIIEDWAHNATLTEEAIDDERGVVLEEYRLGLGSDKRMLKEYLPKIMHGSKYADRLPIGTKKNLENFTYEDVRSFYRDWYRTDLMAVMAVGDLSVDEMEKKIIDHFAKIERTPNPKERKDFKLPNHKETFIAIASDKEATFSNVQIMYKDHKEAKKDETFGDYRALVVEALFATMLNNRLDELRNQANPPFVFGNSFYGGTYARSKNAYQSFAFTSPDGQLRALRVLLEENERVRKHGFVTGEFNRAKKSLLAGIEKQYNDRDKLESGRIIGEYVNHFLQDEPMPGLELEYNLYQTFLPGIKLSEVNGLIEGFIHEDNRVIVLTGPEKDGLKKVTEKQVKQVLEEVSKADLKPYEDEEVASSLLKEVPARGKVVKTETNDKLNTKTFTLSNGVKVTYKVTDFKNDEVLLRAFSPGGSSLYSDEDFKAVVFANGGLSSAGIGGLSLNDMQKFMSGKIARLNPFISQDGESLSGSAAPKDLELLFQMAYLYFTDLNKDDEAYQSYLSKQKGFVGNLMASPSMYFSNEVQKHRNKKNTRFVGFPTAEALDASDYDLAYEKYKERFADASDFHFYLVGNVDEGKLKEYAEQYLAPLPSLDREEKYQPSSFRLEDKYEKFVVKRGSDPKSSVSIVWGEEVDYSKVNKLAVKALGEVLTIKLVEQLREEEGGVYGVGARGNLSKRPYPTVGFSISFPCGPENVDKLTKAALNEVDKLKQEGIQEKDLNKVKETMLVEHKEAVKTNRYWLEGLVNAERDGSDPNKMLDFESKVKALTANELQEIAKKYLDDKYFLSILLPEE